MERAPLPDGRGARFFGKPIEARRAAAMKSVGCCPKCGSHNIVRVMSVGKLGGASKRARRDQAHVRIARRKHKVLTAPRRRQRVKTAKDLYYVFYVLDAFPAWKEASLGEVRDLARAHESLGKKACGYLMPRFSSMDSEGVDLLLSQKPQTTYPTMDDDQFRHYAHFAMAQLVDSLGE